MSDPRVASRAPLGALPKTPTGITGLDEILEGGLPTGRPTLVCGNAGCGKTLMGVCFLVHGALRHDEPGVLMSFEETAHDLAANVSSLGFDLERMIAERRLAIDHVRIERSEIEETGDYDLEALFIRLGLAIDTVGAKRVVLDTIEAVFSGFTNHAVLRAELRRLFRWLKDRGVTALITGERGEGTLTRHGIEEYVSDCVILLDHRVEDQVATRRLRVIKYRGTHHGTNEYPFLIDASGMDVLPVTSLGLAHAASRQRVSTGIRELDGMLGGQGVFAGSSVLVSGSAGTGKSSLAAHFVDAACGRGERSLYFAFEESADQIVRNMGSIGIDLARHVASGMLEFHCARPTLRGLEAHLAKMYQRLREHQPRAVVIDPLSNFSAIGNRDEVKAMLLRLIDLLKSRSITGWYTSLTLGVRDDSDVAVSSLIDTWVSIAMLDRGTSRTRTLSIVKSRGMAHSDDVRELLITDHGVRLERLSRHASPNGRPPGGEDDAGLAIGAPEHGARRQEAS
ncbi:MAG TPA: circadian clock protein KaiC [Candidatus Eisenbacteria bacterium]|nr:circadian clock protein KaiC [Candidatus Eisenbacteria bacterium]